MKFVNRLFDVIAPSIKKRTVMEDAEGTYQQIEEFTIPMLSQATVEMGEHPKLAKLNAGLKADGYSGKLGLQRVLVETLGRLKADEKKVLKLIDQYYGSLIMKDTMDFAGVNLLKYLNFLSFFNRMSRNVAIAMVAFTKEDSGYKLNGTQRMAIEFVSSESNIKAFHTTFKALYLEHKEVLNILKSLEDITASKDFDEQAAGMRPGSTDGFKSGFIPVEINPILLVGMLANSWTRRQYDLAKNEAEMLKLEIQALEQSKLGISNPEELKRIEHSIKYYNKVCIEQQAKIDDMMGE